MPHCSPGGHVPHIAVHIRRRDHLGDDPPVRTVPFQADDGEAYGLAGAASYGRARSETTEQRGENNLNLLQGCHMYRAAAWVTQM